MEGETLGYGVGAAGVVFALAQMAWQRFFSTEGKANDALVGQLTERLTALETRQSKLEGDLDDERKLRRSAEDRVHALEIDNVILRAELKRHHIDVPVSVTASLIPIVSEKL